MMHQVRALPESPGVYLMRDANEDIIYIGKALKLRTRVRSYFGSGRSMEPKVRALAEEIQRLEHVVTKTEAEALHLEATLVKRHQPRYNVRLKDDKHYPYLKIDVKSAWPRVQIARKVDDDGARYFGPYASAGSVRHALDITNRLFPWRSCSKEITGTDARPCLDYFIKRCLAPCTAYCTADEYRGVIDNTILFLDGKSDEVKRHLEDEMTVASTNQEYERAANFRDQLLAIGKVTELQQMATAQPMDADVFAMVKESSEACIQAFFVRGTVVADTDSFIVEGISDSNDGEIMQAFLSQYYESATYIPKLVLTSHSSDQHTQLEEMLTEQRGARVRIQVPQRGEKRALIDTTIKNASEALKMHHARWIVNQVKTTSALSLLQDELGLTDIPKRIECYDISTNQGADTVASMVVFKDGEPRTSEYRRFKIKTVIGQDDFASMREVLNRRFRHLKKGLEQDQSAKPNSDSGSAWDEIPDLVIIDGGKGQLSVAIDVLRDMGQPDIPLCGLAKREEELFVKDFTEPIILPRDSEALYLVQRIRDEAHRFAITYHRKLRRKNSIKSALDSVPGVGPKKKKALLQKFGSVKAIREADLDDIAATVGFTKTLAKTLKESI